MSPALVRAHLRRNGAPALPVALAATLLRYLLSDGVDTNELHGLTVFPTASGSFRNFGDAASPLFVCKSRAEYSLVSAAGGRILHESCCLDDALRAALMGAEPNSGRRCGGLSLLSLKALRALLRFVLTPEWFDSDDSDAEAAAAAAGSRHAAPDPSMAAGADTAVDEPDVLACNACTFHNAPSALKCEVCGGKLDRRSKKPTNGGGRKLPAPPSSSPPTHASSSRRNNAAATRTRGVGTILNWSDKLKVLRLEKQPEVSAETWLSLFWEVCGSLQATAPNVSGSALTLFGDVFLLPGKNGAMYPLRTTPSPFHALAQSDDVAAASSSSSSSSSPLGKCLQQLGCTTVAADTFKVPVHVASACTNNESAEGVVQCIEHALVLKKLAPRDAFEPISPAGRSALYALFCATPYSYVSSTCVCTTLPVQVVCLF